MVKTRKVSQFTYRDVAVEVKSPFEGSQDGWTYYLYLHIHCFADQAKGETYYCDECGEEIKSDCMMLIDIPFKVHTAMATREVTPGEWCGMACILKHIHKNLCPGVEHKPAEAAQCGDAREVALKKTKYRIPPVPDTTGEWDGPFVEGEQVMYVGVNDQQVRWGSNDDPRGLLTIGDFYTVDVLEVHDWHTKLYLKEFPGKRFNSVSFFRKPEERMEAPND